MVYVKDGKLLVSADGKLCSTCCPGDDCTCWDAGTTPLLYTVEFSSVINCNCSEWPDGSDINGIWKLVQHPTEPCLWTYGYDESDGVYINLWVHHTNNISIVTAGVKVSDFAYAAFSWNGTDCTKNASGQANGYTIGNCCVSTICGYGGTADWCENWNPGGCP